MSISQLLVEKDVEVVTRDGSPLVADVFRRVEVSVSPAIVCMSPYGKDLHWTDHAPAHPGVELGPHSVWETPDPDWWVPRGYALVRADARGSWKSPGMPDNLSRKEQEDYYDLIEWVAAQPWCTGKVGLLGISYYAVAQWLVAALQPPHLAAIVPWEGANDLYRDWAYQGGIYASGWASVWWQGRMHLDRLQEARTGRPVAEVGHRLGEADFKSRPFDSEWYRERSAELPRITVPLLSVGNWGAFHLHLRGNVEGFVRASSVHKRLLVHTGSHVDPFYSERGKAEQLRFLDRWLKEEPNGAEHDPPVRLAIRHGREIEWRDEQEWPLARTRWTKLYLDARDGSLRWDPGSGAVVSYEAPAGGVRFETEAVEEDLELTGPLALRLWVSSSTQDMDVFVTVHDIGPDGQEVPGIGPRGGPVPMAIGWLRASHRELDPELSQPYRPYHTHRSSLPLRPGEPTPLEIEIWPTSLVLAPGHRLRLEVAGNDARMVGLTHDDPDDRSLDRFAGTNVIHTGGDRTSYLLAPVIPSSGRPPGERFRDVDVAAAPSTGRVMTRYRNGLWVTEIEGYGELLRHPDREAAERAGRELATRNRTEYAIDEGDA